MSEEGNRERKELDVEDASLCIPKATAGLLLETLFQRGDSTGGTCPVPYSPAGQGCAGCPCLQAAWQLTVPCHCGAGWLRGGTHPGVPLQAIVGIAGGLWVPKGMGLLLSVRSQFSALNLAQASRHSVGALSHP